MHRVFVTTILLFWSATFFCFAYAGEQASTSLIAGILLLVMPAVSTFPMLCRYFFRPMKVFVPSLVLSLAASVYAFFSWESGIWSGTQASMAAVPGFQIIVVSGAYHIFVKSLNRDPVNVVFKFDVGLVWDRVFVISTVAIAYLVPANVIWSLGAMALT